MKRINSRSISRYWLGLIGAAVLSSCAEQSPYSTQQAQCLAVLKNHTAFSTLIDSRELLTQQRLTKAFEFEVDSAFGPKPASGECVYLISEEVAAEQPISIQIGNTLHTDPASIADLIAGRGLGTEDHSH